MDQTNYAQGLMHMIKGNLGTGILAMPASFAHAGLVTATIGVPALCMICTYCVHLLVDSARHLEGKTKGPAGFQYASLARRSFEHGPVWVRSWSSRMSCMVDGVLLISQIGICCVYLVFVADNIVSILSTYRIRVSANSALLAILPIALGLGVIRTLRRLAIASAAANLCHSIGILLVLQYLVRDLDKVDLSRRDNFRPLGEVALGFGSAMFSFEGIAVVLPVYSRLRAPARMSTWPGIINISYTILLILNFAMGLFGFLKFGHNARDSITLNLPPEPLYDAVRALFLVAVFLSYPLQFYVLNEIIWNWAKRNVLMEPAMIDLSVVRAIEAGAAPAPTLGQPSKAARAGPPPPPDAAPQKELHTVEANLLKYEYCCRAGLVLMTFGLAVSVPKLNLLMDLIGSITGTALSLIFPAIIHLTAFWDQKRGYQKATMVLTDLLIVIIGLLAGACGTISSLASIMSLFG